MTYSEIKNSNAVVAAAALEPGLFPMLQGGAYQVQQRRQFMEMCCNVQNKYDVLDKTSGAPVMYIEEDSDCCIRCFCSPSHPLKLNVFDTARQPLGTMARDFTCVGCHWCGMGLRRTTFFSPNGSMVGTVGEIPCSDVGCCGYGMSVQTADGKTTAELRAEKSRCFMHSCRLCKDVPFNVTAPNTGTQVGYVVKPKPESFIKGAAEVFAQAQNYDVTFTKDATTTQDRAMILAATLMTDYHIFEQPNQNNNN